MLGQALFVFWALFRIFAHTSVMSLYLTYHTFYRFLYNFRLRKHKKMGPGGPRIKIFIQKSKFSSRATKNYENKSDLHEISRRIDWERPRGPKIG